MAFIFSHIIKSLFPMLISVRGSFAPVLKTSECRATQKGKDDWKARLINDSDFSSYNIYNTNYLHYERL
jgi:hypothetical protein